MSYEIEAMPDSISINTHPTETKPPIMREEKIFDPYRQDKKINLPVKSDVGQTDKVREGDLPEDPGTREESVKLSPQVAALARKEQRFRQQQQELERERTALAAEKAEIAQLRALKEKLAAKDYSGLDELVNYDEYSQYKVNKLNSSDPVQEEIKRLNGKISNLEKQTEDNISKQFEAAVNERRLAAQELVDKGEGFPRIKKAKAHEAVVQHILDTWEHDNKELSVDQAAKEVEEILVERAKMWAALLEEEKKEAVVAEESLPDKKPLPPMRQGLKTLTNQVTAGDVTRPNKSLYGLSDSDRWAEARRRAEAKLQEKQNR